MAKLILYYIDGNTSSISIDYGNTIVDTGLVVGQKQEGTRVWYRKNGELLNMPKNRYSLAFSAGKEQFLADLETIGAIA